MVTKRKHSRDSGRNGEGAGTTHATAARDEAIRKKTDGGALNGGKQRKKHNKIGHNNVQKRAKQDVQAAEDSYPKRVSIVSSGNGKTSSSTVLRRQALSGEAVASAKQFFEQSQPYRHVWLRELFNEKKLRAVREELLALQRTFKETDLFRVYQTGDLANIDPENPLHAEKLQATLQLRSEIYSPEFRKFVQGVTGCTELTGKTDCSCNVYEKGGHLLCHDDVIGTRCISYILYLSRPGREWTASQGGALELYARDASGAPRPSPCGYVPPHFGSLAFFVVTPGVSYHSVQEVLSDEPRLSISGWFHAASPPPNADSDASLAQLQRHAAAVAQPFHKLDLSIPIGTTNKKTKSSASSPNTQGTVSGPLASAVPTAASLLTAEHRRWLSRYVNPAYLTDETIGAVRQQLASQRLMQLSAFFTSSFIKDLVAAAAETDRSELPAKGSPPDYTIGLASSEWDAIGPPQVQRYLRYTRRSESATDQPLRQPEIASRSVGMHLCRVRALLRSAAFARLLAAFTGYVPRAVRAEVRRFRPGLDYTLAHVGQLSQRKRNSGDSGGGGGDSGGDSGDSGGGATPTVEATACFVPAVREPPKRAARLWDSGDVGGFECFVKKEDEEAPAEVYRADETDGVTCMHAASNCLNLALRDAHTMKFVKYVNSEAPGSRWDVAAEYRVLRVHEKKRKAARTTKRAGGASSS